ncbi:MAG: hypothetical protein V1921_01245 [Candidatus Altiarchaeota archaeon]
MDSRKKEKAYLLLITALTLALIVQTGIAKRVAGYFGSESEYDANLVTPTTGSAQTGENGTDAGITASSHTSAVSNSEGGYRLQANIYSEEIGGIGEEDSQEVYLVPEGAFESYEGGITAYDNPSSTDLGISLTIGWNLVSMPLG